MRDLSSAPALLERRLREDAAGPLVTFYDDATGERVEVSTATFANWVAKTANLLLDGLGLAPGDRVAVALPLHWQALVVVAGAWAAGAEVLLPGADLAAAGVGFASPETWEPLTGAADLVLLALRPMGGRLVAPADGPGWPGHALDYAADIATYGDRLPGPPPGAAAPALDGTAHGELLAEAATAPAGRVLLAPAADPLLDRTLLIAGYLGPLAAGGSVVLCRHADPAQLAARCATERATPVAVA